VNEHAFKLFIAKNFAKALQDESTVYAFIMCNIIEKLTVEHQVKALNNVMSCITNAFKTQILSVELKKYKNVFSIENVDRLSLHEKHDHAIEITVESLYDLLYNLLNTELTTLRQYLDDVLTKE
jgi:hypothetical protein